jgi:TfoX C-terminal domain
MKLSHLPNIGKELEKKLIQAEIDSPEKLLDQGSEIAFLRIKTLYPEDVCINMLYALEGAVHGVRWHGLDKDVKQNLRQFYYQLK